MSCAAAKLFKAIHPIYSFAMWSSLIHLSVVLSVLQVSALTPLEKRADIPVAADSNNPTCVPFYAVRDAIMGGIFHGL